MAKEKTIINFGTYRGEDIGNIPNKYLEWLYNVCELDEKTMFIIADELQDREIHGIVIEE